MCSSENREMRIVTSTTTNRQRCQGINMNFTEYKHLIDITASAEPVDGWDFDRMITLLQNVVLDLDKIQKHVDDGVDNITKTI